MKKTTPTQRGHRPTTSAKAAARPDYKSPFYAVGFARNAAEVNWLTADSLGREKPARNPVIVRAAKKSSLRFRSSAPGEFAYFASAPGGGPVWRIACKETSFVLRSDFVEGADAPPLTLTFDQKANHATLLGLMWPGDRRMALPCVLHLPDMGTFRVTGNVPGAKLDYDARRFAKPGPFVRIEFPAATADRPHIEYRLESICLHPSLPGIEKKPLYDGFRRDFLNIFQVNPRFQGLANNSSSDPCAFTLFLYSEIARHVPPLAKNLTCLDLIRMTLDRYLSGVLGYGQAGYGPPNGLDAAPWGTPWTSLDSLPSFLISACNYAEGAKDWKWARANYDKLRAWAEKMMAADKDGNGLIEYPGTGNFGDRPRRKKRPANWWDTINFGHEDAFSNALAYHACSRFAVLARKLKHTAHARLFAAKAAKLRAAYLPTFLNPETGVLAGWKSRDGELHDYWFTFVQGLAITYGLVDGKAANGIMDCLLAKMREVGYTDFSLGLPGNLVPVKKGDYVWHNSPPEVHGVPRLDDGSDGFPFYENGGATGCWGYFTVKALFKLGRVADARRIFHPMLGAYAKGEFQGFDESGRSRDWRDWKGGGHGYEGLLVDNYHPLLAVLDDVKAKPANTRRKP